MKTNEAAQGHKTLRSVTMVPVLVAIILLISALPPAFTGTQDEFFSLEPIISEIAQYFQGFSDGTSLLYETGRFDRSFLVQAPGYLLSSFFYVFWATLIGFTMSIVLGILIELYEMHRLRRVIDILGGVPDFIMVMVLQLIVVTITVSTGYRIARIATSTAENNAVLLPLIVMVIIPSVYLIKNVSIFTHSVLGQDYMLFAKAKGLSKWTIVRKHLAAAVVNTVDGEIAAFLGILLGNLFIIERLFQLRGITRLLFAYGFGTSAAYGSQVGYQYQLVVNCLFSLLLLFFFLYIAVKFSLFVLRKVVCGE
ncbi:MAG: ABC transporter permease subunit [Spirochaetia bacterium]